MILVDTGQETWYFYHTDGLGSVAALSQWNTAASQVEIVERYVYDAFGNTQILDAGLSVLSASAVGNPILFTGRRLDVESGLYDYRARIVSPALGRFLQPDPLGYIDGMNLYAYVNNNPLNWFDPWGLARIIIHVQRGTPWGQTSLLRTMAGEYGHTWIELHDSQDILVVGSYPSGLKYTDSKKTPDISRSFDISEESAKNVREKVKKYGDNQYRDWSENCTDFGYHAIEDWAGEDLPGSDWGIDYPDKLADDLKKQLDKEKKGS